MHELLPSVVGKCGIGERIINSIPAEAQAIKYPGASAI
jgi:hypothetical protein